MKFFVDTADTKEIRSLVSSGLPYGVTTNPSLVAKSGRKFTETEVLVACMRHPIHLVEAAKFGDHVATRPPAVPRSLFRHPLTEKGLETFVAGWAKTGQQIA